MHSREERDRTSENSEKFLVNCHSKASLDFIDITINFFMPENPSVHTY